ncbi:MAG: hypothetical protein QOD63_1755 [Actinomycetota bacterium]|nr:hypothetical protein [Actinomycetota bacterium]
MAIRIARGARAAWREGRLQFRVQSTADPDLLQAVVSGIGHRLVELDTDDEYGPKFVSDLLVLPDGVAFWLDSPDASPSMADRIVATIVEGLEGAGIDGRLSGGTRGLDRPRGPQVAGAAVPDHAPARDAIAVVPWDEMERALDWALEDPTAEVVVESGAVFLDLPHAAAREYVTYLHRRGRSCHVLAAGPAERRECSIGHPADDLPGAGIPHLGLAWSGPTVQADVDAAFEVTVAWARTIGDWAAAVHVTVHPDAHEVFVVRPPWPDEPSGRDATVALADHVLDAYPWQRLRPSQAELLPHPLHSLVSYDPATGELRMGRLDHWLREPATARREDFTRAMRAMLGRALATRDVAWVGRRELPTSLPRPAGELPVEEPRFDLDTVPIVGYPCPHPSLGVTPLELLSLRRGGSFHDVVDVSLPLRRWLTGLAETTSPQDHEPIRRIVEAFTDVDVGERHGLAHMAVLEEWLVRRLTPALVGAAGFGDPDLLRDQLPPPAPGRRASDTVAVLLGVLAEVVDLDPGALGRNPYDQSPAARTANSIAHQTGAASCIGQPRGRLDAFTSVDSRLRTMLWNGTPFDDRTARALWWTGALAVGSEAVAEAYERASVRDARLAHRWRDAEPGPWPQVAFADAGAPAVYRTDDPGAAWDAAVELGAAAMPAYWARLTTALADRLPAAVVEAGWANARRTLASIHARTRLAAANAARGATAAMLCQLVVGAAADAGRAEVLRELTWVAVDDLVRDLAG